MTNYELRRYFHIDPDTLNNDDWAAAVQALTLIKKEEQQAQVNQNKLLGLLLKR